MFMIIFYFVFTVKTCIMSLHFSNEKQSWPAARVECKKMGGDLVSLETPEENYCLRYILYVNGNR
jgi:hypothetical protein